MFFLAGCHLSRFSSVSCILLLYINIYFRTFIKDRDEVHWNSCLNDPPSPQYQIGSTTSTTSSSVSTSTLISAIISRPYPIQDSESDSELTPLSGEEEGDDIFVIHTKYDPELPQNAKYQYRKEKGTEVMRDVSNVERNRASNAYISKTPEEFSQKVSSLLYLCSNFFRLGTSLKLE